MVLFRKQTNYIIKAQVLFMQVIQKDYNERIKKIYNPKVKFLKKIIKRKKCVLDIGSNRSFFKSFRD